MRDQTRFGTDKEEKVADSLRRRGARVQRSPGSRGGADLKAEFPSGTRWNVQVKATRQGEPSPPSPRDLGRLKQGATQDGATAIVANVSPQGIRYVSARTGRTLTPPSRKK
jgi:hypothetical protein